MTSEVSTLGLVRDAATRINRAVVELGPGQLQLCAYFDRVNTRRTTKELILSPIAAGALPPYAYGPVRVHCLADTGAWTLVCRTIEPIGACGARVDLEGAQLAPERAGALRHTTSAHRPLALVVPSGVPGCDAHVFPVLEIDAAICVIDATVPLDPGQDLGLVELVGDRHLLRRASATVTELKPWCTADGSRRFHCTLRLRAVEHAHDDPAHDATHGTRTVSDPLRVKRVVEFAGMAATRGWYDAPGWGQGVARFAEADRDSLLFSFSPVPAGRATPRFVSVGFSLFSVGYELTLRVLERNGSWVRTAMPLHLRSSREFRPPLNLRGDTAAALRLCFNNPVSGGNEQHAVCALSSEQVEFEDGGLGGLHWDGLPLEAAILRWPGHEVSIGNLRVDAVCPRAGKRVVEASIIESSATQHAELATLITQLGHPAITVHDGKNFRSILHIYKEAGLFAPHMRNNLDPIIPQAKRFWHAMHQPGADFVRTFVHGPADAPDAAVSVVQPWEHTWLSQHFVSVSPQFNGAAGHLQRACLDYVLPRTDGQHLTFFVKADNRQMNAFFERFLATTGTPEASERRTVQLWCREGSVPRRALTRASRLHLAPMRTTQEPVVSRAIERVLGAHGTAALSFVPGEFHLPKTTARFARVGLVRKRSCSVVSEKRSALWAVIEEITSPGFNFTWMLNASWILPVHADLDTDGMGLCAAIEHVLDKPAQTPTGDVFVNVIDGFPAQPLLDAGFAKLADVYLYTLNRAGLNRYFYYTSDRYGEVDVRTQQRQQRRSGIQLRAPRVEQVTHAPSASRESSIEAHDSRKHDTRKVV